MERLLTEMCLPALTAYLQECRTAPAQLAVVGHPAPDTDAVVSALFEAFRRWLTAGERAVPVVQADALPRETAWLLGETGGLLLTAADSRGAALLADERLPLVLTDHHTAAQPRRVAAVVDHHPLQPGETPPCADAEICAVGAATTLVALHCHQAGLQPDAALARMLLGAILLDTEGLSPGKTREPDARMAAWLAAASGEQPAALFESLRAQLLAETALPILYRRDQRWFPGLGFAILKLWASAPLDTAALRRLLAEDCAAADCRVCLAKVSRYTASGLYDETYYAAGEPAAVQTVLAAIAAAAGVVAGAAPDSVYIPPQGRHLSRKRLTPLLLPLLAQE